MTNLTDIYSQHKKKIESERAFKIREAQIKNDLRIARLEKKEEIIKCYQATDVTDEKFYDIDNQIEDMYEKMEKQKIIKSEVIHKIKVLKIDPTIIVAVITTVGGILATHEMIVSSKEDFIDDKPLKIWSLFGKKH